MSQDNQETRVIVVKRDFVPSTEDIVLAYGQEAFNKCKELRLLDEGPVIWDGTTSSHIAVGGEYGILSDEVSRDSISKVQELNNPPEKGIPALDENGEITRINIDSVDEVLSNLKN